MGLVSFFFNASTSSTPRRCSAVVWSLQPTARCADQKAKPLSICSHMEADLFVTSLNEDKVTGGEQALRHVSC